MKDLVLGGGYVLWVGAVILLRSPRTGYATLKLGRILYPSGSNMEWRMVAALEARWLVFNGPLAVLTSLPVIGYRIVSSGYGPWELSQQVYAGAVSVDFSIGYVLTYGPFVIAIGEAGYRWNPSLAIETRNVSMVAGLSVSWAAFDIFSTFIHLDATTVLASLRDSWSYRRDSQL